MDQGSNPVIDQGSNQVVNQVIMTKNPLLSLQQQAPSSNPYDTSEKKPLYENPEEVPVGVMAEMILS